MTQLTLFKLGVSQAKSTVTMLLVSRLQTLRFCIAP